MKQWTVNQCVTEFVRLCDQAFTPREFSHVIGLTQATTINHGSKYRTTPLREALHSAFGDELLYGGSRKAHLSYNIQVAVTATSGTGETPLVLANYSRPEESEPSYKFEFPHNLLTWEAAGATSAAPSFFKPFVCMRGFPRKSYLDGALHHNNPASVANLERKFLWPDVAENPPDILLSLGTGKYGQRLEEQLAELETPIDRQHQMTRSSNPETAGKSKRKNKAVHKTGHWLVARLYTVLVSIPLNFLCAESFHRIGTILIMLKVNRIDNILDTELEWKRFRNSLSEAKQTEAQTRFIRVNLDLWREPPRLDEKQKLADLQALGTRLLKTDEYRIIIEKIAHMLVASTFYFVKDRFWYNEDSATWTCIGLQRLQTHLYASCNQTLQE